MNVVPDNAVVAVLSMSTLLLPASVADSSTRDSSRENTENTAEDVNSNDVPEAESDIFVGYERMKDAYPSLTPSTALKSTKTYFGLPVGASGTSGPAKDGGNVVFAEEARNSQHGHVHQRGNAGAVDALLVTALPFRLATDRQQDNAVPTSSIERNGDIEVRSAVGEGEHDQKQHREAEGMGRARLKTHALTPPPAERQVPFRLSMAAPLPLLVFDTETFSALGELDERFSFQGGVAEWISRARLGNMGQGTEDSVIGDLCCDQLSLRRQGPPRKMSEATHSCATPKGTCFDGAVQHVHEHVWGRRFVRSWPEDDTNTAENAPPKGSRNERASEHEVIIDKWNRLAPGSLEALVQADADLFFLPYLLSWPSPGDTRLVGPVSKFGTATQVQLTCVRRPRTPKLFTSPFQLTI